MDGHLAGHHEVGLDWLLPQEGKQREEERHPGGRLPPAREQVEDLDEEVEAADGSLHVEQALIAAQVAEGSQDQVADRAIQSASDAKLGNSGYLADPDPLEGDLLPSQGCRLVGPGR